VAAAIVAAASVVLRSCDLW